MGDYSGLYRWDTCNLKGPYKREEGVPWSEEEMWQWKQTCSDIGSQVKKCGQILEAGKAKGT